MNVLRCPTNPFLIRPHFTEAFQFSIVVLVSLQIGGKQQHLKQFSTDRQLLFAFNTNCVYWKTECLWPVNMLFCLLKLLTFSASFYPPTTEENWTNSHGVEENGKLLSMWVAIGADLNLIEKFLSPSWMRLQRPLALSDASSELCDNDSSPLEQIINT